MLAINYSTIRNNLKTYCDKVSDNGETIIITRKDEKNIVILSLEQYNDLKRYAENAEYLAMLDRSLKQLKEGNILIKDIDVLESEANK